MRFAAATPCVLVLLNVISSAQLRAEPLGTSFTYQGLLTQAGVPVNGPLDLVFTLWDDSVSVNPVNQLGSQLVPGVNIVEGLFTVTLNGGGEFGPVAFNGQALWLEVTISGTPLLPRQPLTSAPYALRSRRVENLELTDHVVLGDGTNFGSLTVLDGGNTSVYADGDVGWIQADRGFELYAFQDEFSAGAFQRQAWGGWLVTRDETGATTTRLGSSSADGGFMELYRATGGTSLFLDGDDGTGGGFLSARDQFQTSRIELEGAVGSISLMGVDGQQRGYFSAGNSGTLTLRDNSNPPSETARLLGNTTSGGSLQLFGAGGTPLGVLLDGDDGNGGEILLRNDANTVTVELNGNDGNSGVVEVSNNANAVTVSLNGNDGDGGGRITVFDGTRETIRLDGSGSGGGAGMNLFNSAGQATISFDADESDNSEITMLNSAGSTRVYMTSASATGGGFMRLHDASGHATIEMTGAESAATGGCIAVSRTDGTPTVRIDGDFNGRGRVTTCELEITGGCDLSEHFDISAGTGSTIQPGHVVCIDPKNPTGLRVSESAYDRRVAGIVSGAGGVRPGMLMSHRGTIADGKHPVALTGRVYCWCDASEAPIEPGDLLTTASTPGHAMKVTEHTKAQGAILGKAMGSLREGRSLVLVLVSLQ
ncbi:MAG: hypothetical protein AMXMBFR13_48020 [Phycisphaerae bacterium]